MTAPVTASGDIRERLVPGRQTLWPGYVHALAPDQTTLFEYRNMSDYPQDVVGGLLTLDGALVENSGLRSWRLEPNDLLTLDGSAWAREAGRPSFEGQVVLLIDKLETQRSHDITPAVTTHWRSKDRYCEVATQGFSQFNTKAMAGRRSFYMFCPCVELDAETTTRMVLFNHSTEPGYRDRFPMVPNLSNASGETIEGRPVEVGPHGAWNVDVAEHFGPEGEALLRKTGGRGSLSVTHVGHIFPSLFFHVDRRTRAVITGQHTQPPATVFNFPGVWWGRLRNLLPCSLG